MDSLEALLRRATAMINRQVSAKTPAREICARLAGRVMAIRLNNTALAIYLIAEEKQLRLSTVFEQDPDVIVCGSLLALMRMAGPGGEDVIRSGEVDLSGDALVAAEFQKLLRYGRPDIEEELSAVVGDAAAHGIGEVIRGVGRWSRETRAIMRQNVGEYLKEESRSVPSRDEVSGFQDEVDALRDDVARFEARLKDYESSSGSRENG